MSDDHSHHDQATMTPPGAPTPHEDSGSQALAEALRSSFFVVQVLMVVLVVVFLASGVFQVKTQERAVVLRLGSPVGGTNALLGPGLHWSFPYPIDEVVRIKYSEIQKVTSSVGWYLQENAGGMSLNPAVDNYTLTSDGNIIHTRATLYYRIVDPIRYEFDFLNASNAVQNALDNALVYASTRFTIDQILTKEGPRFQETVQARVSELVDKEKLGIVVERPPDMETTAPLSLKPAFENVVKALSTQDKIRNDAFAYRSQTLNGATAEAARLTNTAQLERTTLVASVRADAANFTALLPQYQANPALVANVLLYEKIAQVLTNVEDKIYLPERADGHPRELRLQLSREPQVKTSASQMPPM
jgi:membrane protease subunit HflK